MTDRQRFEDWFSANYCFGGRVERRKGEGYMGALANAAWDTWQTCRRQALADALRGIVAVGEENTYGGQGTFSDALSDCTNVIMDLADQEVGAK